MKYNLPVRKNSGLLPALLLVLFAMASGLTANAHNPYVFYLKDGNMVRCVRYGHLRDGHYQLRLDRRTEITIAEANVFEIGHYHRRALPEYRLDYRYDSTTKTYIELPDHYVHTRGFFFQGLINVGLIDGVRVAAGYRLNRYFSVGACIGFEYGATITEPAGNFAPSNPNTPASFVYNSGYAPMLLYITGDICKTQFTPFYSFEAGWLLPCYPHLVTDSQDGAIQPPYSEYNNHGGPTAGAGIGLRIYTRRRNNLSISANVNAGYVSITTNGYQGYNSNPAYIATTARYSMVQPALRFAVGF